MHEANDIYIPKYLVKTYNLRSNSLNLIYYYTICINHVLYTNKNKS